MTRKKGKPINFDVIVKFFLQHYEIPTRSDVDRLIERLDRLERTIRASAGAGGPGGAAAGTRPKLRSASDISTATAAGRVLAAIGEHKNGAGCDEVHTVTGFDEKKIRNTLYRLNKLGKIERKDRGLYVLVKD